MIRLFVKEFLFEGQNIILSNMQAHYLKHVMRVKENEKIVVLNGEDGAFEATVKYQKKIVALTVASQLEKQKNLPPCGLAFALIKKENTDFVLQKATELGVTDIFPLLTERTAVRQLNMTRAEAIITEATEQCERLDKPRLHALMNLKTFLSCFPACMVPVFLSERELICDKLNPEIQPIFIVGPEGGFSKAEADLIHATPGMKTLHLGQTVLRAETASIAVLSAWNFRLF